ncbi:MAG: hypothetical protein FWC11_01995 [Firmicutes bacterium]|nr:hypothetical protein [Bacillota bacterium]
MNFEKKLIILTGDFNAKGTLTLERNAHGVFATINIYNIPDLTYGEYVLGLKCPNGVKRRELGGLGRVLLRFKIDDVEFDKVHCVIFSSVEEIPLLYGTISKEKLWHANMMDGLRKAKRGEVLGTKPEDLNYSSRDEKGVENFFLDILPKDHHDYRDNVVAQVNYYPENMRIDVNYSPRVDEKVVFNPIDEALETMQSSTQKDSMQNLECRMQNSCGSEGIGSESVQIAGADVLDRSLPNLEPTISPAGEEIDSRLLDMEQNSGQPMVASTSSISENKQSSNNNCALCIEHCALSNCADEAASTISAQTQSFSAPNLNININSPYSSFASLSSVPDAQTIPPLSSFTSENAVASSQTKAVFYEMLKEQIDEMFKNNPPYEQLAELMPQTKWVRIEYDDNNKFYVVGLIGEKPDYICYGVPAKFTEEAPEELDGYAQWVPLNPRNPEGEGFWLMFQDAETGESVEN